jgi:hypothetical protein
MAEEIKKEVEQKTRRAVVKTAAQVAVTAPAVGLLLSASTKSALAQRSYGGVLLGDDASQTDHGGPGNNDSSDPDVIFTSGTDDGITLGDDVGNPPGTGA